MQSTMQYVGKPGNATLTSPAEHATMDTDS